MRRLMWFAAGFGAACAFCAYISVSSVLLLALGAILAGFIFAFCSHWVKRMRIGATVCIGLAIGFCWFWMFDNVYLQESRSVDEQVVETAVTVVDYSFETEYGCAVDGIVRLGGIPYKVRVYLNENISLEPGNRIVGSLRFAITTDYQTDSMYHQGDGLFLLGFQRGNLIVERCHSAPLCSYAAIARNRIKQILLDAFGEDTQHFAVALLIGDRTGIDYETSTNFKLSGISHIIAVSGLHVSILFGLVYLITGKRRVLTALIGVPLVLMFAAVAGFSPSITRASLMQIVMMLALLFEREYDPLSSLSFAGLVMLLINPLVITSVSFQLSFCCMLGIILLGEPLRLWLMERKPMRRLPRKVANWLCAGVGVSIGATVFTAPLVAVYFGTVSLVATITNLLVLWVVTVIFYGVMIVCLIGTVHAGVAAAVAAVVSWPIRYVYAVTATLAQFPLAAVYTKSVYIVIWLVFCYCLLGALLILKKKPAALSVGLSGLMLCVCLLLSWLEPMTDTTRLTVCDVGQGQALILRHNDQVFVIDCGGDYAEDAADTVAETLLSQGVSRVDGIILTHYDADHAAGVQYLLTRIEADVLLMPHSFDDSGTKEALQNLMGEQAIVVREDLQISLSGGVISLFAPVSYNSGNESSMGILFESENCDILVTGDMGQTGERLLMKYHTLPQVDVLIVGHHGAAESASDALLQTVTPKYALISVDEDNSYGHPSEQTLARLAAWGCVIFRTDEDGTIIFRR